MSTQPNRPGQTEEIDEDLRCVLDEHIESADKDPERISREDWRRTWSPKAEPRVPR
jgi:hypothetical protein